VVPQLRRASRPLRARLDDLPRERLAVVLAEHSLAAPVSMRAERRRQSFRERDVTEAPTLGRCQLAVPGACVDRASPMPLMDGKVERSHRVDDQEFYQLLDPDGITGDVHLFNEKLKEWEDYYNYHRPHGALSGQTPYERLLEKRELECHQVPRTLQSPMCPE
jgi:hypothetical protein